MPPSRSPFSYAVVRVVPDIEREEFLNAGLILFCRPRKYLSARTRLDADALTTLCAHADGDAIGAQLAFVEAMAAGTVSGGPFGDMSQSERFHWLTAPASTMVQPSPVHTGLTSDPEAELEHLFLRLVRR